MGAENRDKRISETCEVFAERLRAEGKIDFADLVATNQDLEPELSQRLNAILAIWRMARQSRANEAAATPEGEETEPRRPSDVNDSDEEESSWMRPIRDRTRRIHCPHCGIGLQLVDEAAEITCRACGSSIVVDPNRTRTLVRIPQQKIGHFTLLAILGKGSFGTVYKARDEKLDRIVAVKIPRDGYFESERERRRFMAEARHASRITHPNVVRVYEIDEEDNIPFIVSELIEDGFTLNDLASSEQLEFKKTTDIIARVCDGIQEAHDQNVIHRDLKPSNILLDRDHTPYVADFGLARLAEGEIAMTMQGEILGTILYMSPEQAAGDSNKVNRTSDTYSIGVMLYRLLSGSLPFRGTDRMVLHQVKFEDPKPLRSINDNVPRDLETITLKAMAKESEKRYESAAKLAADLRHWANGEPISARPVSRIEKAARWCRRHPLTTGLLGTIATLFIVALSFAVVWAITNSNLAQMTNLVKVRLAQAYEKEGERLLENDDLVGSLTWFVEALNVEPAELKPERHRIRLGMVLNQCPTLNQLLSINSPVTAIEVSKDGTRIAVGDASGKITMIDGASLEKIDTLRDHQTAVQLLQFSDDATKLVSCAVDTHAVLWDIVNGERISRLSHDNDLEETLADSDQKHSARKVVLSSNSELVLSTGWLGTARLWNIDDGQEIRKFSIPDRNFDAAAISPDGKRIAVASYELDQLPTTYFVSIWDAESGELKHDLEQSKDIRQLVFNRNGTELRLVSDRQIRFLSVESGEDVRSAVELNSNRAYSSFANDNEELLTLTDNGELSIWNLEAQPKQTVSQLLGHGSIVDSELSVDRTLIATVDDNGLTHLDFVNFSSSVCCSLPGEDLRTRVAFHPDGRRVVTGNASGVIRIWDLASTKSGQRALEHNDAVNYIASSPDGNRLITSSMDKTAGLWQTSNGNQIGTIQHDNYVFRADFSFDGSLVATASTDETFKISDGKTAREIASPGKQKSYVVRMAVHPKKKQFAFGTHDGHVSVWEEGDPTATQITQNASRVMAMEYSKSGEVLAVGYDDGTLLFVELNKGNKITKLKSHDEKRIDVIRNSSDGLQMLTGGWDQNVRFWNLNELNKSGEPLVNFGAVRGFDVQSDGLITVADSSGRLTVWNPEGSDWNDNWIKQLNGTRLTRAEFHSNGQYVGVAGNSTSLKKYSLGRGFGMIYDVKSRTAISPRLNHSDDIYEIVFDPNGRYVATCSVDNTAIVWELKATKLDIEHLRNLSTLYTSTTFGDNEQLVTVRADILEELFRQESTKHPDSFRCTSEEISNFKKWAERATQLATENVD